MSSHTDKDYVSRLEAMISVIVTMESAPREKVRILSQPYKRLLTPWRQPWCEMVSAVAFGKTKTPPSSPEMPVTFPSVEVPKGYLGMNKAGRPCIFVPATHMNRLMDSTYRQQSVPAFLSDLTIKAKSREEILSTEAYVWEYFGQFLSPGHQFKVSYASLQQRVTRLEHRGRRKAAR